MHIEFCPVNPRIQRHKGEDNVIKVSWKKSQWVSCALSIRVKQAKPKSDHSYLSVAGLRSWRVN
jgi:hypothetical protein